MTARPGLGMTHVDVGFAHANPIYKTCGSTRTLKTRDVLRPITTQWLAQPVAANEFAIATRADARPGPGDFGARQRANEVLLRRTRFPIRSRKSDCSACVLGRYVQVRRLLGERERCRRAFSEFDPLTVARFTDNRIDKHHRVINAATAAAGQTPRRSPTD
jgi:hypothetical protein